MGRVGLVVNVAFLAEAWCCCSAIPSMQAPSFLWPGNRFAGRLKSESELGKATHLRKGKLTKSSSPSSTSGESWSSWIWM